MTTMTDPRYFHLWTHSFESEEIVQYHFSDINWAQGQNMSHLIKTLFILELSYDNLMHSGCYS